MLFSITVTENSNNKWQH